MPKCEQEKGAKRDCEIAGAENGARPNRGIKRGEEQTYDRRIRTIQRGPHRRLASQPIPKGQNSNEQQKREQVNRWWNELFLRGDLQIESVRMPKAE